jgi:hypothetical protein
MLGPKIKNMERMTRNSLPTDLGNEDDFYIFLLY